MSRENWASYPGGPPQYFDVLDRLRKEDETTGIAEDIVIVRRNYPYGYKHEGWQGQETIICRVINLKTGRYRIKRLDQSDGKILLKQFAEPRQ